MLTPLSFINATVYVGGVWTVRVYVTDVNREPVVEGVTVTVTAPEGGDIDPIVATASARCRGVLYASIVPEVPGRYVAQVSVPGIGVNYFTATVVEPTATAAMPDVAACIAYMGGDDAVSFSDEDIEQMLEQETLAQARVCRVPAAYPGDLRGALLRRVQRATAMRALALGVREASDADGGSTYIPGRDPEVRRLEAPFRKVMFG